LQRARKNPAVLIVLDSLIPSTRDTSAAEAQFDELRLNGFIEGQNLVVIPGGFDVPSDAVAERATALVKSAPDVIIAGPDCSVVARMIASSFILKTSSSDFDVVASRSRGPVGLLLICARASAKIPARSAAENRMAYLLRRVESQSNSVIVQREQFHGIAAGSSELPWQEWVDRRIDASITAAEQDMGKVLGKELDAIQPALQLMQRELATLRDEVRVLREQLGLSRELASLRSDVEQARAEVPNARKPRPERPGSR
jgi:hypothetical protein